MGQTYLADELKALIDSLVQKLGIKHDINPFLAFALQALLNAYLNIILPKMTPDQIAQAVRDSIVVLRYIDNCGEPCKHLLQGLGVIWPINPSDPRFQEQVQEALATLKTIAELVKNDWKLIAIRPSTLGVQIDIIATRNVVYRDNTGLLNTQEVTVFVQVYDTLNPTRAQQEIDATIDFVFKNGSSFPGMDVVISVMYGQTSYAAADALLRSLHNPNGVPVVLIFCTAFCGTSYAQYGILYSNIDPGLANSIACMMGFSQFCTGGVGGNPPGSNPPPSTPVVILDYCYECQLLCATGYCPI